jgi:hypothetical protein
VQVFRIAFGENGLVSKFADSLAFTTRGRQQSPRIGRLIQFQRLADDVMSQSVIQYRGAAIDST